MTIAEVSKSITEEFSTFMSRIQVIEGNITKMYLRLQDKLQETEKELEFQKKESARTEEISKLADSKLEQAKETLKESKAKHDEAEGILKSIKDKESQFKRRQDSLSIQESSAEEKMQAANKLMSWAEMEDRRVRFLQKKIDLVTQDESIKKKLRELE